MVTLDVLKCIKISFLFFSILCRLLASILKEKAALEVANKKAMAPALPPNYKVKHLYCKISKTIFFSLKSDHILSIQRLMLQHRLGVTEKDQASWRYWNASVADSFSAALTKRFKSFKVL